MEQGRLNGVVRPIVHWPGKQTVNRRYSQFSAPESASWDLLKRELRQLGARNIILQIALREDQLRIDGWPKATARPAHPGLIVSFDSKHGPLNYACDTFHRFSDNLRGIAKGLEALRLVERYGIAKSGEQYAGYRALAAGPAREGDAEHGRRLIATFGGVAAALKATHPDTGGEAKDFEDVQAARAAGA